MRKILIVSYSMTGNTWKASSTLGQFCDADRDTIRPLARYEGWLRSLWALWGALTEQQPEIEAERYDPACYDLVVLASPVWAGRIASPMRSYIMAHRQDFSRVAFLCTQRGAGAEKVFDALSDLCAQHPVATLALTERSIAEGRDTESLRRFANQLTSLNRRASPPRASGPLEAVSSSW